MVFKLAVDHQFSHRIGFDLARPGELHWTQNRYDGTSPSLRTFRAPETWVAPGMQALKSRYPVMQGRCT